MFLPHPLLRHRGHGEPSYPCVSAAAHSPKKNPLAEDLFFLTPEATATALSFRQARLTSVLKSVTSDLQVSIRRFQLDVGGVCRVTPPQAAQTSPRSRSWQPPRGVGAA